MMSWKKARVLGLLALSVIGAGWLGDSAAALFSAIPELCASHLALGEFGLALCGESGLALLWFLLSLALFFISLMMLYRYRSDVIQTTTQALSSKGYVGHSVLIMALSPRPRDPDLTDDLKNLRHLVCGLSPDDDKKFRKEWANLHKGEYSEDKFREFRRHPWRQNLRVLNDSLGDRKERLRKIIIVPSNQTINDLEKFKDIAENLVTDRGVEGVEFEPVGNEVPDFEDFDAIYQHIDRIRADLRRSMGRKKARICIDITSGTKVYTAAAISIAVTRELPFSYVDNTGRVHYAMARVELPHLLEP
ncbi:hypothetical protein PJ900_02790 (plasmid) [Tistrella mobilis]|uniref:CRISPR-associated protein n=1 Tax=Tistrella mobilis TaxID=171437 RepID=A0A162KXX8_9PROT|nr:hypothetical protein [Tistrella mobilis]KYO52415.1 hypothetical protein AUP44_05380 [Tistrella mobilis]